LLCHFDQIQQPWYFPSIQQPPVEQTPTGIDLSNKTILITGSNKGMGLESARQLLILKASSVILAVRNTNKGQTAKDLLLSDPQIKALPHQPDIKIMEVDMTDYNSV
jgi:NAD(P)-dependent dehydrogenase (short-subunit alcohol dehydrogenase family)